MNCSSFSVVQKLFSYFASQFFSISTLQKEKADVSFQNLNEVITFELVRLSSGSFSERDARKNGGILSFYLNRVGLDSGAQRCLVLLSLPFFQL